MWRSLLAGLLLCAVVLADEDKDKPAEKGKVELSADEKALFELLNKARAREKLAPLKINPVLCKVARRYSAELAKEEEAREKKKLEILTHRLNGKGPGDRAAAGGYDYRLVLENLAWGEGRENEGAPPAQDIHKNWMDSKSHRHNILDRRVTEIGVGMARSKKGNYFYTQVFGKPRR